MEVLEQMNEQEMKRVAIEKYVNIQRIKKHGQEEVEYQEKIARAANKSRPNCKNRITRKLI